jgi:hypothetical protein
MKLHSFFQYTCSNLPFFKNIIDFNHVKTLQISTMPNQILEILLNFYYVFAYRAEAYNAFHGEFIHLRINRAFLHSLHWQYFPTSNFLCN